MHSVGFVQGVGFSSTLLPFIVKTVMGRDATFVRIQIALYTGNVPDVWDWAQYGLIAELVAKSLSFQSLKVCRDHLLHQFVKQDLRLPTEFLFCFRWVSQ